MFFSRATTLSITLDVNTIGIIGDGPMAYIEAIALLHNGYKGKIYVIGPRINEFTRSGDFAEQVFKTFKNEAVIKTLGAIGIELTSGRHIKDLENQLYKHLILLQNKGAYIEFIHKKFERFAGTKKQIIITDKDGSNPKVMQIDLAYECTGKTRAVIAQFNKEVAEGRLKQAKPFLVEKFADKQKYYALVRAVMDPEEMQHRFISDEYKVESENDAFLYALTLLELKKLGWNNDFLPRSYANVFPKKNSKLCKFNIYVEITKELNDPNKSEQIKQYVDILFKLYSRSKVADNPKIILHQKSSKPSKLMIQPFEVWPDYIDSNQTYFLGNEDYPALFIAGDALANLPFISGHSLVLNIDLITKIIGTAMIFKDNKLILDQTKYFKIIGSHITMGIQGRQSRANLDKEKITKMESTIYEKFRIARAAAPTIEHKEKIQVELDRLSIEHINGVLAAANTLLHDTSVDIEKFEKKMEAEKKSVNLIPLSSIEKKLERVELYVKDLMRIKDKLVVAQRECVNLIVLRFADCLKQIGTIFYSLPTSHCRSAEKYYSRALQYYTEYFPDQFHNIKLALYSNLIICAFKQSNFERVVSLDEQVKKEIIPFVKLDEGKNKVIMNKILFHRNKAAEEIAKKKPNAESKAVIAMGL